MSLDETYDRMRTFGAALAAFDDAVQESRAALQERHADVEGLWRDAFAREYSAAWEPLDAGMRRWCQFEGPEYRAFVTDKLRALERYLGGDR